MRLNDLKPAPGSGKARKRVGRGMGSGFGKTCGKGHKGQNSRSGGGVRPGFEGGQMPLQMRLPKFGFTSRVGRVTAEVRTSELNRIDAEVIDLDALCKAGVVQANIKRAKVMLSGDVTRALTVRGLRVSKGARAAIEAAGGKIIGDWDQSAGEDAPPSTEDTSPPADKTRAPADKMCPPTDKTRTPAVIPREVAESRADGAKPEKGGEDSGDSATPLRSAQNDSEGKAARNDSEGEAG